jgi:H+/gluconate symporter-like permease
MTIIFGIILVAFVIGLISREKGDGFLDTLSSGCSSILGFIFLMILIIAALLYFNG